jgi:hypothetical protein
MKKTVTGILTIALYAHALTHKDDVMSKPSLANREERERKVQYGEFNVPARDEDNGMLRFKRDVDPPCSNCVITVMSANLEYPNGTTADAANGMWLHHILFYNKAHRDDICGEKEPGQRFFGAGNDRTPLDLTNGG